MGKYRLTLEVEKKLILETEGNKKKKKRFIHLFSPRHCATCCVEIITLNLQVTQWSRLYFLHSVVKSTDRFSNLPKISLLKPVKLVLVLTQYDYRGFSQNLNYCVL